jgi:penicillin-binding protein 1A
MMEYFAKSSAETLIPLAKKRHLISRKLIFFCILLGVVIAGAVCITYASWAARFNMKEVENIPERSAVYDMDGKFYSRFRSENRVSVRLDKVAPEFVSALLAREDSRFFQHHGIDPVGILRAVVRNLTHGSVREGASTITQQLARNSFPLGGHTLHRKILEAFVAFRIEGKFAKKQILEFYINRIYFGSGFYGVETASQAYFGKPAWQMNLSESAMLVGIIRSPNRFSPFHNREGATAQRDAVLERMAKLKMITREQADRAAHSRLAISKKPPAIAQDNYAMDAIRRDLDVLLSDDQIEEGGLRIYTTIDPQLQNAATTIVDTQLGKIEQRHGYSHPKKAAFAVSPHEADAETDYLQGAVVTIDNHSGGIRALVGGRDYAESKFNRALLATRQIGSTFKPFVYAAAFADGLLPGAEIDDSHIQPGELRTVSNWSPDNSDNTYRGIMRAEDGLILSRNTMSVRIGDRAGLDSITHTASMVGLGKVPHLPAIYLGAFETTLKDLTAAYTVFPNNGTRQQPYVIERIDNADGEVLYRASHLAAPALDPGVSWLVSSTLQKVLTRGTAASARSLGFKKPAAGKTGTTNDFHDAWFVGYTESLTCGVWVGLDHPATIMSRGYGAALALPIWVEVMNSASPKRYPSGPLDSPTPLVHSQVCSISNQLATSGCLAAGAAYEIDLPDGRVPTASCQIHGGNLIDAVPSRSAEEVKNVPQNIFRSFRRFFGGH